MTFSCSCVTRTPLEDICPIHRRQFFSKNHSQNAFASSPLTQFYGVQVAVVLVVAYRHQKKQWKRLKFRSTWRRLLSKAKGGRRNQFWQNCAAHVTRCSVVIAHKEAEDAKTTRPRRDDKLTVKNALPTSPRERKTLFSRLHVISLNCSSCTPFIPPLIATLKKLFYFWEDLKAKYLRAPRKLTECNKRDDLSPARVAKWNILANHFSCLPHRLEKLNWLWLRPDVDESFIVTSARTVNSGHVVVIGTASMWSSLLQFL